jgi:esterase/lipase superfamily enzyme
MNLRILVTLGVFIAPLAIGGAQEPTRTRIELLTPKETECPKGCPTSKGAAGLSGVEFLALQQELRDRGCGISRVTGALDAPTRRAIAVCAEQLGVSNTAASVLAALDLGFESEWSSPPGPAMIRIDSLVRVQVYYATDRKREKEIPAEYGNKRGGMEYGQLVVTIPPDHRPGELESPSWVRLGWSDRQKHVVLERVVILTRPEMFSRLAASVRSVSRREVFVFVHGFNVTFRDAARRTAQIAYDLNLQAVPVLYSWPSQGTGGPIGYTRDSEVMDYTAGDLSTFLEQVATQSGATKIHLLAHSMGSLALSKALQRIGNTRPRMSHSVILAAPDIDADVFRRDIASVLRNVAKRITLYASDDDGALDVSKKVNGVPRVGQAGRTLVVLKDIETVDASRIEGSWLGHSYIAESKEVLDDLFAATILDQPADRRNLRRKTQGSLPYWVLP